VGTSTFTGAITANGGITNNTNTITNNSTLTQVGTSTFTGAITANGGITCNGLKCNTTLSNPYYVGGENSTFDSTAISTPKVKNGIASGTGDGSTYSVFNNAINSWYSTGFINTYNNTCNAIINHRTGAFITNGDINTNGTVYCPIISGTNGLEHTTTLSTGIHNFKIAGVQKVYINNTDLTNTVNLTQVGASTFTGAINANGGINGTFYPTNSGGSITGINGNAIIYTTDVHVMKVSGNEILNVNSTNITANRSIIANAGITSFGNIVANNFATVYSSLPDFTGTQIGGSYFLGYAANLNYYTGFHSMSVSLPIGYYLANGYIAITPSAISLTLSIGLGANDSTFLDDYIKTQKTTSLDRIYSDFTHYLRVTTATTYYLNLYNGGTYDWLLTRYYCNFIRIR
jgi:Phage T4 tail fibre